MDRLYLRFAPLACALCLFAGQAQGAPADSLEFSQFAKKLSAIFSDQKIRSIISKLPDNVKIYGYDIGDITGDDRVDVVLSAGPDDNRNKILTIYFFINGPEAFALRKTMSVPYYGEPIEVAFSIERGICYLTRKIGEFRWSVTGYRIDDLIFRMVDRWETRRLNTGTNLVKIGCDSYDNFETLRSTEHFFRPSDNKSWWKASFSTLPAYHALQRIPEIYPVLLADTIPANILSGSSSWFGPDDLSFEIGARYDSTELVLTAFITDDVLFPAADPDSGDAMEFWFDVSGRKKVEATAATHIIRGEEAKEVCAVRLRMGDGAGRKPSVAFDDERLKPEQKALLRALRWSVTPLTDGRYKAELKLPMGLFRACDRNDGAAGFTAVYYDRDNPRHPEWITVTATSDQFIPGSPKTFGALRFIPRGEYYGGIEYLNAWALLERMKKAGLM